MTNKTMYTVRAYIADRTFSAKDFQSEVEGDYIRTLMSQGQLFGEIDPQFTTSQSWERTPLTRITTVEISKSMININEISCYTNPDRVNVQFWFTDENTEKKFKNSLRDWILTPRWIKTEDKFTLITFDLYYVGNQVPEINTTAKLLSTSSSNIISERNDNESESVIPSLQNINIDINIPEKSNSTQEVEVDLSDSRIKFDCLVDTIDCDETFINLIQKGGLLGESYYDLASTDIFRVYAYTCTNPIRAYYVIKGYRFDYKNERLFITIDWLNKSFAEVYNSKPEDWRFVPRIIWDGEQMKAIPFLMEYAYRNGYCLITFDVTISKELERRFNAFTKGPIDGGGLI